MKNKLMIIGASGHGKVVADIAKLTNRYKDIVFLDDNDCSDAFGDRYLGKSDLAYDMIVDYELFVAIGNSKIREMIMKRFSNAEFSTLIHPNTVISPSVKIGKGTVVMAGSVINADAVIGDGVIINTCSSVDHDCVVEDYSHVSVGSHLCGTVNLRKHTWVGAGATIINNIDICSNCFIGAGAVVVDDLDKEGTYIGVPAKRR